MNRLPFFILFIATFLISATSIFANNVTIAAAPDSPAPSPAPSTLGCDEKCDRRCAKSGYKGRCLKYCGICCGKCEGCVPSSPSADKAECPCYRDLKNPKGEDKCP